MPYLNQYAALLLFKGALRYNGPSDSGSLAAYANVHYAWISSNSTAGAAVNRKFPGTTYITRLRFQAPVKYAAYNESQSL